VADAGLGTINAVRLSMEALVERSTPVVVLNRYDPSSDLHRRNLAWLRDVDAMEVTEATEAGLVAQATGLAYPSTPGATRTILPSLPPAAKRS
jgi:dethiobiotin synthetase